MSKLKEKGIISGSIRHQKIVWVIVAAIVAFGIYALFDMKKDEFPAFTIRQGIVAGVYPGANSEEVEAQLTKPLEQMLFEMPEVDPQRHLLRHQRRDVLHLHQPRRIGERQRYRLVEDTP